MEAETEMDPKFRSVPQERQLLSEVRPEQTCCWSLGDRGRWSEADQGLDAEPEPPKNPGELI